MAYFLGKLLLGLIPLLLTPLWAFLMAESYLDLGGGDKDLLLLIPWSAWSLIYFSIYVAAWKKQKDPKTMVIYSVAGATGVLLLAWIFLFIWFNWILGAFRG